ncbi:MAG: site-specific DNA-methyltransferase [Planctomycetaceae bacterium]|jgi:site-specific DNA-methyltransferase (adenine-specific)|nr:site-specific DNA-methyltransferase [Planctomycetaceae bacterium]
MDWNTVILGDCIKGMRQLGESSVDLVFADPPFNIGYSYDVYKDNRSDKEYLQWSKDWMSEVYNVLKSDGTFWLAIGDEYAAELKFFCTREIGFICRSWVVWYYTFGVNCTKKFTRSHVHLFHFVKDAKNFTFNNEAIRIPSARQLRYNDKRANPKGRLPDDTWILNPKDLEEELGPNKNTWLISRVCGTFKEREGWHGCQMPEKLLERIILVSSNEGEKVIDPFAGSGTTLVAARNLDRQYLGFEISEEYREQCLQRLAKHVQSFDTITPKRPSKFEMQKISDCNLLFDTIGTDE